MPQREQPVNDGLLDDAQVRTYDVVLDAVASHRHDERVVLESAVVVKERGADLIVQKRDDLLQVPVHIYCKAKQIKL